MNSTTIMTTPPLNDSTHGDLTRPRMPMWLSVICLLFAVVITVTAICGNALVLAAFIKFRSKLFSVFNVFALFLAITDLVVGLVTLPLFIWYDLYYHLTNSTAAIELFLAHEELCFLETYFDATPIILSLTTLFLMATERCIAVFAPIKHEHIRRWQAVVVCGLVWTTIILMYLVDMIVNRNAIVEFIQLECDHYGAGVKKFSVYYGVSLFVLSWVLYGAIFVKLCCISQKINEPRKVTKMTVIILTAFTIAYLPDIVIVLLYSKLAPVVSTSLHTFFTLFLYANSAVNPFIYNKGSDAFHSAFRKLLCLKTNNIHANETAMSKTENSQEKETTTKF